MAGRPAILPDAGHRRTRFQSSNSYERGRVPGAAQREPEARDALQTPISGLPEIGAQMRAGRVNPTCMDRYTHRLRDGPGPAVHRFAIARAAPHPGHG